jgi:hypothetical protein
VRLVHLEHPLSVKIDGRSKEAVVMMDDETAHETQNINPKP